MSAALRKPRSAGIDQSRFGQANPLPSPTQNVANELSRTPNTTFRFRRGHCRRPVQHDAEGRHNRNVATAPRLEGKVAS